MNINKITSTLRQQIIAGLVLLLVLTVGLPTFAQTRVTPSRRIADELPLDQPLARTDARAQLPAEWQSLPTIPYPAYAVAGVAREAVTVEAAEYNVATGTVTTLRASDNVARSEAIRAPQQWPGNIGPDARLDAQDAPKLRTEGVIGPDNRVRITNTTAFPWRAMTKLYITFPNGNQYVGSGVLIAAKYVLTAGHVVYSATDGGWAKSIAVVPGLNGSYAPYGWTYVSNMRTYRGWTQYADSDYDIALVTLQQAIGSSTGWLGYAYFSSVNGTTANLAGYPGDRDYGLGLYYDYGPITSSTTNRVSYTIDTASGQSGSGVYRYDGTQRYVFAVHTNGGVANNSGTRITSARFDDIKGWIASGY